MSPKVDPNSLYKPQQEYTAARAWSVEGARVAVVTCVVTCKACGGVLFIDPSDDFNVFKIHDDWHRSLEAMHGWANTRDGQVEVTVRRTKR